MSDSVSFDRVAGHYDRTRGMSEEGTRRSVELLNGELRGRGRVLEVGAGTGQLLLRLREAGVEVVGLDLAETMLLVLIGKAGGGAKVPLVLGDATAAPFRSASFGGAYLRWVLHLIPDWRGALAECVRVLGPGGVVLVLLGDYGGPRAEIQAKFDEIAGTHSRPVGLDWGATHELDAAMAELGATLRLPPLFREVEPQRIPGFLDSIDDNAFSWTWRVPERQRVLAAAEVRRWVAERLGPAEEIAPHEYEIQWRAYDVRT
jgi:SAM-dependent methyltransferase